MAIVWSTELLRLSLFSSEQLQVSGADWTAITGQHESETRQTLPGGGRSYVGKHRETQLTISSLGQRIDVIRSVYPPSVPQETKAPIIGDWEQVRDVFAGDTEPWLKSLKFSIVRIAFSCVLLVETADRMAAYELLKTLLKSVQVEPAAMRELIFRINWPLESTAVPNLRINRITNWNSVRLRNVLLQLGDNATSVAPGRAFNFVRLETDHNTDEDRVDPFAQTELVPIYRELVGLASENAAKGERP
jgi:hypothetical protein